VGLLSDAAASRAYQHMDALSERDDVLFGRGSTTRSRAMTDDLLPELWACRGVASVAW